jgi:hypothetical protein
MTTDSLLQTSIRVISAFFCIREFLSLVWILLDYVIPLPFPRTHGTTSDAIYSLLTCVVLVLIARNASIISKVFTSNKQSSA